MRVLRRDDSFCEKNASEVSARADEDADDKDNHRSSEWGVQRREQQQQKTTTRVETETETFAPRGEASRSAIRLDSSPRRTNTPFTFRLPFGWTREGRDDETTTKMKKKKGEKKDKTEAKTLERCAVCSANGKLACGRCNGQGASFCTDPRIGGECRAQVSESKRAPLLLNVEEKNNVAVSLVRMSSRSVLVLYSYSSLSSPDDI